MASERDKARWRVAFGLITLFVLTALAVLAAEQFAAHRAEDAKNKEHEVLEDIRKSGGFVYDSTDYDDSGCTIVIEHNPTDKELAGLQAISDLKEVWFGSLAERMGPNDDQLIFLGELVQLRALSLNKTEVTDAGLIHLRRLKNLRYLDLSFDDVTYDGLSELLPYLSDLEWLYIDYNEHVSPEQERKLSALVPGCKIFR
jgi:hypothetical protein